MENNEEIKDKIDAELSYYKPKKSYKNTIFIIVDILILFLVAFFVVGYLNFSRIKDQQEPIFVIKEKNYTVGGNSKITVYDNIIYKIVKQENTDVNVIYSLKLWFMDEVE